jgi:hypothetical protein
VAHCELAFTRGRVEYWKMPPMVARLRANTLTYWWLEAEVMGEGKAVQL